MGRGQAGAIGLVTVLGTAALLAVDCGRSVPELLPGGRGEHSREVARLERRVEEEDGWIVLPVPNLHEGGGTTTWWLHPCDPATDDTREVTRTAFHGSDVAGLPGVHQVEHDELPCEPPRRAVHLGNGRRVELDVEVVALRSRLGLLEDRDHVTIRDPDHDARLVVETMAGQPALGPCDGRAAWTARLQSPGELDLDLDSCVDTVAALPEAARDLLDVPEDQQGEARDAGLPEADLEDFDAALTTAGWEADTLEVRGFEGTHRAPLWRGPCGPALDDGETRPVAHRIDGRVELRERPCP